MRLYRVLVYKAISLVKRKGLRELFLRLLEKALYSGKIKRQIDNVQANSIEKEGITLENTPLISIVVPVFNTRHESLINMIESVLNQTYSNLELCIFNGGSNDEEIETIINEYKKSDNRIKYLYSKKNYGIAGNTNRAIALASGEYIGMLDHDDMLVEDALLECIKVINRIDADFIYSNEDKITEDGCSYLEPHIKSKWAPNTLMSYNFICHFTVFKSTLYKEVGGLREEYDGSQDYDFILRLTKKATQIYHIPKILYHWRISNTSTALNIETKPYAIDSGEDVIKHNLADEKLDYIVTPGRYSGSHVLMGNIRKKYQVTIAIIGNWINAKQVKRSYDRILSTLDFSGYKVVFINRNNIALKINELDVVNLGTRNYAQIINYIMEYAYTEHVIIKEDNVKLINKQWCQELIEQAQEEKVSIVAPKLLKSGNTIYSFGVRVTESDILHNYFGYYKKFYGYMGRCTINQNVTAVSEKMYLIKKSSWKRFNKLNETYESEISFIDFCLKANIGGYFVKLIQNELGIIHDLKSFNPQEKKELLDAYKAYLCAYDYYTPVV